MYSWSGIGVPTTKAIIRESARLVNLTLGRAGFFAPQAPTRRATSGTSRASPSECVPRYPEVKGRGSICYRKSPPLTALDFWIFWAIPSTPTEQETCVSRPVVSASIPQKPLLKAPSPDLWNASEQVALRFSQCPY